MRAVVSIGGSVLVPDLDAERVSRYADVIESLDTAGHTLGTVVGRRTTAIGGNSVAEHFHPADPSGKG